MAETAVAMAEETSVATAKATAKARWCRDGDGNRGSSSGDGNGGTNSSQGNANSGQGGGRCGGRRFHVEPNIGFLRLLAAKKAMI
jgi:hypothetical protein